jgi:hypothetical protein
MNMSVVKGGSSANLLVRGMSTEWGQRLYARTLLSNVAQSIYKERDAIIRGLRDSVKQQARRAARGARRAAAALSRVAFACALFACARGCASVFGCGALLHRCRWGTVRVPVSAACVPEPRVVSQQGSNIAPAPGQPAARPL